MARERERAGGKGALEKRDAWQILVDFLQQSTISCKLFYFAGGFTVFLIFFVALVNLRILKLFERNFIFLT